MKKHAVVITLVCNATSRKPGEAMVLRVTTATALKDLAKAIATAARDVPTAPKPSKVVDPAKELARRARMEKKRVLEKARAERQARRSERDREANRRKAERDAKRQAREAKKAAAIAKRERREWIKGTPAAGDPVEYQEKAKGRRRHGRVVAESVDSGRLMLKINGDRGAHWYPATQARRTLKVWKRA